MSGSSGLVRDRARRPAGPVRWRPTAALARAVLLGAGLLLLAVLLRRADLVLLAAPLLLGAVLGLAARPVAGPALRLRAPSDALLEGGRATVTATVDGPDGIDVATVRLDLPLDLPGEPDAVAVHIPPAPEGPADPPAATTPMANDVPPAAGTMPDSMVAGGTPAGGTVAGGAAKPGGTVAGGAAKPGGTVAGGAAKPGGTVAGGAKPGGTVDVAFRVRAMRWGRRQVGPAVLRATGGYGMLSWPPVRTETATVTTWPLREGFGGSDVVPRAEGLVGGHVSRRPGEGGDLAGVRPFVPGDRLRRINWRVTGRTGELHVTATYSDRDTEVLLLLDSGQDLGRAPESSLDIGVRAAAAIAEHYLRVGDRVGLVDLGSPQRRVPPRNGRNHLVRLLDLLMDARPRRERRADPAAAEAAVLASPNALVVLLSPLTHPAVLATVAAVARSGRSVVAIDTLPPDLRPDRHSDWTPLAFRIWRLRRGADIDRLAELGVPVVAWHGPGSLDAVLRDVARATRAARAAR